MLGSPQGCTQRKFTLSLHPVAKPLGFQKAEGPGCRCGAVQLQALVPLSNLLSCSSVTFTNLRSPLGVVSS